MPWTIEKQPYPKYIEDFYQDLVYSNFGSCSDLPEPDSATPWNRGNYTFKDCFVDGDGLPEIAPQGFYKVIFTATGEVDWGIEAIVRITDKHSM